eukprot:261624-Prymnesium_polylepis.1
MSDKDQMTNKIIKSSEAKRVAEAEYSALRRILRQELVVADEAQKLADHAVQQLRANQATNGAVVLKD